MINNLSPEIRRFVVKYADNEKLSYDEALKHIMLEGIKAISETKEAKNPVCKHVYKPLYNCVGKNVNNKTVDKHNKY